MKTLKRITSYISILPLILGVVINFIFYLRGFQSFGFKIQVGFLLSVGLLSFEIINRLHLLKSGEKSARVIFFVLVTFSVLFNLSGFASSVLTNDQENENIASIEQDQKQEREEVKERIEYLKKQKEEVDKNLTFYSYQTKKYETVTPVIEKAWEKAGTVSPGEIQGYRNDSKKLQEEIKELYESNDIKTEYQVQKKNIFDLLYGTTREAVRVLFFFCLSVLIALMPSMNMKYFYNLIRKLPEKITPMEIKVIAHLLWKSVSKHGAINSIRNLEADYKINMLSPFQYEEQVSAALHRLENVIICKRDNSPHYYAMDGVTKEKFYELFKKEIES
jgi:hypothetical protein